MPLFTCLFGVGGGDHFRVYKIHMGSQSFHKQLRVTMLCHVFRFSVVCFMPEQFNGRFSAVFSSLSIMIKNQLRFIMHNKITEILSRISEGHFRVLGGE